MLEVPMKELDALMSSLVKQIERPRTISRIGKRGLGLAAFRPIDRS